METYERGYAEPESRVLRVDKEEGVVDVLTENREHLSTHDLDLVWTETDAERRHINNDPDFPRGYTEIKREVRSLDTPDGEEVVIWHYWITTSLAKDRNHGAAIIGGTERPAPEPSGHQIFEQAGGGMIENVCAEDIGAEDAVEETRLDMSPSADLMICRWPTGEPGNAVSGSVLDTEMSFAPTAYKDGVNPSTVLLSASPEFIDWVLTEMETAGYGPGVPRDDTTEGIRVANRLWEHYKHRAERRSDLESEGLL